MLKVLIGVIAALGLSLVLNWNLMQSARQSSKVHKQLESTVAALETELTRTRANVLAAARNAATERTELQKVIIEEVEWSAQIVPSTVSDIFNRVQQ